MQTQYPFSLPRGYVDGDGVVHREGVMRLATALDEIEPRRTAEVRENPAYLSVLLLSRVIERIGTMQPVSAEVVENLFAGDFDHLQRLYERLNPTEEAVGSITCPGCQESFEVDLSVIEDRRLGE